MTLFLNLILSIFIALLLVVLLVSLFTLLDWIDDLQNHFRHRKQLKHMIKTYMSIAAMQTDPIKKAYFTAIVWNCKHDLIHTTKDKNK